MTNIIVMAALAAIIAPAAAYLCKAKKSGAKCVGCPYGGCCHASGEKGGGCSCGGGAGK